MSFPNSPIESCQCLNPPFQIFLLGTTAGMTERLNQNSFLYTCSMSIGQFWTDQSCK